MPRRMALLACVGLAMVACGDAEDPGTDAGPAVTGSGDATSSSPVTLGGVPDIGVAPGSALLFLPDPAGQMSQLGLDVVVCTISPDAVVDGEIPAELLTATATGATDDGTEVQVDVHRFRSQGAAPTLTDTVEIVFGDPEAPDRVLVAQRFEVDGVVSDLRDPRADDPLLVVGPGGFEARGLFAPPGAGADAPEIVEGVVRAGCE